MRDWGKIYHYNLIQIKHIRFTLIGILTILTAVCQARETVRLYEGAAPGSEDWTWEEVTLPNGVMNVTTPTLTVYRPEKPNGISVVVCPGGAFMILSVKTEGEDLAKKLNEQGITAVVLRYRLHELDEKTGAIFQQTMTDPAASVEDMMETLTGKASLDAMRDALHAMAELRRNASKYGIDPHKIGIQGSSAGGCVVLSVALSAKTELERPDFVVDTYGYQGMVRGNEQPSMPLFIVAASDDQTLPVKYNALLTYHQWLRAGQPVEMHLYQQGGHGFGGKPATGTALDNWTDVLCSWLKTNIYPETK